MFTLQHLAKHPLSDNAPEVPQELFEAMWRLFVAICRFWDNISDPTPHRMQLYNFITNRIKLYPIYHTYYINTQQVIDELVARYGAEEAYKRLLTDREANAEKPPQSSLALARQMVSNEFVSLQLALGGFKEFGAKNYCGYVGGPYIPDHPVPYRT